MQCIIIGKTIPKEAVERPGPGAYITSVETKNMGPKWKY